MNKKVKEIFKTSSMVCIKCELCFFTWINYFLGEAGVDGEEEDFVFESKNQNENDDKFDLYVGAL